MHWHNCCPSIFMKKEGMAPFLANKPKTNRRAAGGISLIGHGVYLKGCVLSNLAGLALTMGFPLVNIEISDERNAGLSSSDSNPIPQDLRFPFRNKILKGIGNHLMFGWDYLTR